MEIHISQDGIFFGSSQSKKRTLRQKGQSRLFFPDDYTIVDIETTGYSPDWDRIIDVAAVRIRNNEIEDSYHSLVKYTDDNDVPVDVTELNGISEEMIVSEGRFDTEVLPALFKFVGDDLILGYNANFDINFLYDAFLEMFAEKLNNDFVDVLRIARKFYPNEKHNRLKDCMERIHIDHQQTHRGMQDCLDTFAVYNYFKENADPEIFSSITKHRLRKRFDLTTLTAENDLIDTDNPFFDKFVCFTGKLDSFDRKTAAQAIVNLGGNPQNGVTKKTNYLVLGDTAYSLHGKGTVTGKLNKARELISVGQDLSVISEKVFLDMIADRLNEVDN